jgi:hypothetical protein
MGSDRSPSRLTRILQLVWGYAFGFTCIGMAFFFAATYLVDCSDEDCREIRSAAPMVILVGLALGSTSIYSAHQGYEWIGGWVRGWGWNPEDDDRRSGGDDPARR